MYLRPPASPELQALVTGGIDALRKRSKTAPVEQLEDLLNILPPDAIDEAGVVSRAIESRRQTAILGKLESLKRPHWINWLILAVAVITLIVTCLAWRLPAPVPPQPPPNATK